MNWGDEDQTVTIPRTTMAELVARPACVRCHGSGRMGVCGMYECNHCAGTGVEYPLEIVAESVAF